MSSDTVISAAQVRDLREKTGAGMMDCKKALSATAGDIDEAIDYLRKQGVAAASKRSGRETREGQVAAYIHPGGKIGVLIEIGCETDFVARTDDYATLCRELAMQVAASEALAVDRDSMRPEWVEKEREILKAQVAEMNKPPQVIEKIIEGKLEKFFAESCLLEQPYIRDPDRKVIDLVTEAAAKMGENISVRRFTKYRLGEE
jgi:elongation factor Ts